MYQYAWEISAHWSLKSRIPKLPSATSLQPYVRQEDDIVAVDPSRIIPPQKELLNVPRPVEGIASGLKRKVSFPIPPPFIFPKLL